MQINEILKHKLSGNYQGYELQRIREVIAPFNLDSRLYRKLKRIPPKISHFLHRDKIKEVYKSDYMRKKEDNYYIILSTDETFFMAEY